MPVVVELERVNFDLPGNQMVSGLTKDAEQKPRGS
jgi:hypothetical protein